MTVYDLKWSTVKTHALYDQYKFLDIALA